jgi:hypothetical protein
LTAAPAQRVREQRSGPEVQTGARPAVLSRALLGAAISSLLATAFSWFP